MKVTRTEVTTYNQFRTTINIATTNNSTYDSRAVGVDLTVDVMNPIKEEVEHRIAVINAFAELEKEWAAAVERESKEAWAYYDSLPKVSADKLQKGDEIMMDAFTIAQVLQPYTEDGPTAKPAVAMVRGKRQELRPPAEYALYERNGEKQ